MKQTELQSTKFLDSLVLRLDQLEQQHGPDDYHCFPVRHQLAHAYRALGRFRQAIEVFKNNLESKSKNLGMSHHETINSQSSLANCYYASGQYQLAIQLFTEALNNRTRILGSFHPDTLRSIGSLANSYLAAGQSAKAKELHQRVLNLRQLILGANHPSTIVSLKHVDHILESIALPNMPN